MWVPEKKLEWKAAWVQTWKPSKKLIWVPDKKLDWKEAWKQTWVPAWKEIWVPAWKQIWKPVWISEWFPSPDPHEHHHHHEVGWDRKDTAADTKVVFKRSETASAQPKAVEAAPEGAANITPAVVKTDTTENKSVFRFP